MTREEKRAYNKAYREANKEKARAYQQAYREANREAILVKQKAYREANKEHKAATDKAYRETNKERLSDYHKTWRDNNKECRAAYDKHYRSIPEIRDREKARKSTPEYRVKERANKSRLEYRLRERELKNAKITHFVVYMHTNKSGDVYIGEGNNLRPNVIGNRHKEWKKVFNRDNLKIDILYTFETKLEAQIKEMELIAQIGLNNLVNIK